MRGLFAGPFFYQNMPSINHRLIDAIKEFRREQAQVVFECLRLVLGLIRPVAMAQHLAQGAVLIGQFMNAVKVSIQAKTQNTEHQNPPLLHSWAARVGISLAFTVDTIRHYFAQYGEDSRSQCGLGVDVLQPAQNMRNVVSRFGVQMDRANVHAIKRHLGVEHIAHGFG